MVGCGKSSQDAPVVFPPAMDQCLAASDMELIVSLQRDGGVPEAGPFEVPLMDAFLCGRDPNCLNPLLNGHVDAGYVCVNGCYDQSTSAPLSADCRYCYIVDGLFCAGTYCLNPCLGTNLDVCNACFLEQCRPTLDTCVGF